MDILQPDYILLNVTETGTSYMDIRVVDNEVYTY
jgi:hypothetical protein